ncbi:alcohol dehydrogenase [Caldovatus sediminis]|uniref:alcohol dehydrogenase n=2 Tax=Caldovatus sediminis TaxID=2041189 RepID=A0A8J3EAI5_9PROT|nr:alcohol dehydrogenase [Caldovatus sediminis]
MHGSRPVATPWPDRPDRGTFRHGQMHAMGERAMRAMVVRAPGGPEALALEEVPPPALRPNDARIRVEACGVCFHDVVTRNGTYRRGVRMPLIPGHEVSGVVESVGPAVRRFRPGDRVCTVQRRHICGQCRHCRSGRETSCPEQEFLGDLDLNGGYAELVCVEEDNVAKVPEGVPLDAAAIAACAIGTELNAVRDVAAVRAGERVLVTGAGGGLGVHGVQLARLSGAEVVAVTGTPGKVAAIREAGAEHVVLARRGEDFSAAVKAITGGEGVDVAIDNVGSATFEATRRSLAEGGRWILVGQLTGEFVRLNPAQLFLRDLTLRSVKSTTRAQLEDALGLMRRGLVRPVIAAALPLEAAAEAHRMMERAAPTGRVLLKPGLRAG